MARISYLSVCFCAVLTAAVSLSASGSVAATETKSDDQRIGAVITEWYLAHCGAEGVPDVMINASSMVINGSEKGDIERLREEMRAKVKSRFRDTDAACAGLKSVLRRTFEK